MVPNALILLIALSSVTAQTFQYSRGWTNGKRDGQKKDEFSSNMVLNPCQMRKLKYLLVGKPLNDQFYASCDYHEEEAEAQTKRYKAEHSQNPLFELFQ